MILTNRDGWPEALRRAVELDPYTGGVSDISVTRLIMPPQILVLSQRYASDITEDVSDRLWATFGQLFALLLERLVKGDATMAKRYWVEERLYQTIGGWSLSGQYDLYDTQTKTLQDWKFVGEYAYKMAKREGKPEWEAQLNILRWLLYKSKGILAEKLEDVCVARDYTARSESPGGIVSVPVWSLDATEAFILDRIQLHQKARELVDADLPNCTPEETWGGKRCARYCAAKFHCRQYANSQAKTKGA